MEPIATSIVGMSIRHSVRSRLRSLGRRCSWLRPGAQRLSGSSSSGIQPTAKGLISLPSELQQSIIELVVLDDSYDAPSLIDEQRRQASPKSIYPDPLCRTRIHVQPNPVANSAALLACCKGLASQTRAVIERLDAANKFVLELDVLLVGERELWTTWLRLPFAPSSRRIKHLVVSIRIAGGHQHQLHPMKPSYQLPSTVHTLGSQSQLAFSFQYLLAAVLCRSATLDLQDRERYLATQGKLQRDCRVLVDHLYLDISTCEGISVAEDNLYQAWLAARPGLHTPVSQPTAAAAKLRSLAMRPQWLADILETAFSSIILVDDPYSQEPDCQLFFNRIGDVNILTDDTDLHIDVGQRFAKMEPASEPDAGWWHKTLQRRYELDFPIGSADHYYASTSTESMLLAPASSQDHN